jgi:hypothetical protein
VSATAVREDLAVFEALADLRARLDETPARPVAEDDTDSPLGRLCTALALTPFERDLLLLCAGVEIDDAVASRCEQLAVELRRPCPSFAAALVALPDPHWSALSPARPLRRWNLVELEPDGRPPTARLRIAERVLQALLGVAYLDEPLSAFVAPIDGEPEPAAGQRAAADEVATLWKAGPLVVLCGADRAARCAVAAAAAAQLGLRAHALEAADVPASSAERQGLARLWEREAVLGGVALLVELEDAEEPERARAVRLAESLGSYVALGGRQPAATRRPAARVDGPKLAPAEQRAAWAHALGPQRDDADVAGIVAQFDLGADSIRAAAAAAARDGSATGLWDACRAQARPRLDDLAERIEPLAVWDDLVLPQTQLDLLRQVVVHVRRRARVYETWGFSARSTRGLGVSALFAGPSGTGKTMAAEILASELRLDLYRIDLSSVVSKYIGETEKNLRRVFDAAESGGAVLLFDEADALFGKRSEVKDSHDRYANVEISYLLQRMEAYRGLAILTTNMRGALDTAFMRRIRFVVEFPFPAAAQRAEIWARIFPAQTPTDGLDAAKLARLNVAGGTIRNIALGAAFLAADAEEPVGMPAVLAAARTEYAKLERGLSDAEIGGWS